MKCDSIGAAQERDELIEDFTNPVGTGRVLGVCLCCGRGE